MITPAEHPVFQQFEPWKGEIPAGYEMNFVGQRVNTAFKIRMPKKTAPLSLSLAISWPEAAERVCG